MNASGRHLVDTSGAPFQGGDYDPPNQSVVTEIANGIREVDPTRLH